MARRVLLTGGTGLVGTDILRRLVADGYEVVSLSRRPPRTNSPRVTWIEADLTDDPQQILEPLPTVDHVVHAAAVRTAATDEELAGLRRVNVDFTGALYHWAARRGVAAVTYISGLNFLRRPLSPVIDESHPVAPETAYAESKVFGETALAEADAAGGLRGVSLRLSSPIAFSFELLHDTVVRKWIDQARSGRPVTVHGRGERTQDFVATEDVAAAVVRAIETSGARGAYNVASGSALPMRELASLVAGKWGTPVVFGGDDPNEAERWNISIDRAGRELGYRPRYPARATIERLLATIR